MATNQDNVLTLKWENQAHLAKLAHLLRSDKIAITETDTVVGLLGQLSQNVRNRISTIKQRPSSMALPILIDSFEKAAQFADISTLSEIEIVFLKRIVPGPATVIFTARKNTPRIGQGPGGTIALRIPDHDGLREILKQFDGLFSTSANRHGDQAPATVAEVDRSLVQNCSVLVTGDRPETPLGGPSSIIDLSQVDSAFAKKPDDCPFRVVRIGAVSLAHLKAEYEKASRS